MVRTQSCQDRFKMFNSYLRKIVIIDVKIYSLQIPEELIQDQVPRSPPTANFSGLLRPWSALVDQGHGIMIIDRHPVLNKLVNNAMCAFSDHL